MFTILVSNETSVRVSPEFLDCEQSLFCCEIQQEQTQKSGCDQQAVSHEAAGAPLTAC